MEGVIEDYMCSLCYELFLYPVTLPCNHIFCKLCFDQHIDSNGFTCPMCRRRLSNWLRKLNLHKSNIVDSKLWKKIQQKFPKEVRKRKYESVNDGSVLTCGGQLEYSLVKDRNEKEKINNCHSLEDITEDISEWSGWPVVPDTTCRDVIHRIILHIGNSDQRTIEEDTTSYTPQRIFAKPGEIREEYHAQLLLFQKESQQKEEKNLKLSEALIKLIEEDERKEMELLRKQKEEQLRIDEELAKSLLENDPNAVVVISDTSTLEDHLESDVTSSSPYADSEERMKDTIGGHDSPVFLGPCLIRSCSSSALVSISIDPHPVCSTPRISQGSASTSKQFSYSPIPLDQPSCSKDDIFAKYWTSSRNVEESNQPGSSNMNLLKTTNPSSGTSKQNIEESNQPGSSGINLLKTTNPSSGTSKQNVEESNQPGSSGINLLKTTNPSSGTSRGNIEESNQPDSSDINLLKTTNRSSGTSRGNVEESNQPGSSNMNLLKTTNPSSDCGEKTVTMSRSSSGADSIGQELCHFKPIRTSPTTPHKDGKSSWLPKVVVAQKSVTGQELPEVKNNSFCGEVLSALSSSSNNGLSIKDLEESLALENQLSADRKLALQIEREWSAEESKKRKRSNAVVVKANYNLRKKRKISVRKKVLLDQRQTTLDTMLIK